MDDLVDEAGLLKEFVSTYLWADEDWLEWMPGSVTYWQARVPTTFTVDGNVDWLKWRAITPVVEEIHNSEQAVELCLALNFYAAGWTFVWDAEERSINALIAMAAPLTWRKSLVRFAEAAKFCAWLCDATAEGVASAVGGRPCLSHPTSQESLRQVPDAVNFYPTVLRSRPEGIFDPTPYKFPDLEVISEIFEVAMGGHVDSVEVTDGTDGTDGTIRLSMLDSSGAYASRIVQCGFDHHPLLGMGWKSEMVFPWVPDDLCGTIAMEASWAMFKDSASTLIGSWIHADDEGLTFRQWTLTPELRSYEQLPEAGALGIGTHDAKELWDATSTLTFAAQHVVPMDFTDMDPTRGAEDANALAVNVMSTFRRQAAPSVAEIPTHYEDRADRRLLWLRRQEFLLICGWFNPNGPTLVTLEVCRSPVNGEPDLLMFYRRHSLLPKFLVIAEVSNDDDLLAALPNALDEVFTGSPPNFLTFARTPEHLVQPLTALMEEALARAAADHEIDLPRDTWRITSTLGEPWAWASIKADDGHQLDLQLYGESNFARWLAAASESENVLTNLMAMPDAWDGSLNFQQSYNNLNDANFDIGPFVVIYSSIGRIDPDTLH